MARRQAGLVSMSGAVIKRWPASGIQAVEGRAEVAVAAEVWLETRRSTNLGRNGGCGSGREPEASLTSQGTSHSSHRLRPNGRPGEATERRSFT